MTSHNKCGVDLSLQTQLIRKTLMVSMVFRLCNSNVVTCTILLVAELQVHLYGLHGTKQFKPSILTLPAIKIIPYRILMTNNEHLQKRPGMVLILQKQLGEQKQVLIYAQNNGKFQTHLQFVLK